MDKKIRNYFLGKEFSTEEEIEKELTELVGFKAHCYDTKIDDGLYTDDDYDDDYTDDDYDDDYTDDDLNDEVDRYLMLSAFDFKGHNMIVRIYYGDVTSEITDVEVTF